MASKTVLIAEDDPELVKALTLRMEALGLEVRSASDGLEVLVASLKEPPDLLILDVNMPAADGLTVCEKLIHDHDIPLFPVIILTGASDPETIRRCESVGAHYFHKEPDVWDRLGPVICRLLGIEGAAAAPSPSAASPTILVVDDDPDFTEMVRVRLEAHGVRVVVANNGKQGYWMALMEAPDVILTDLTMPGLSGEAMMRKLMFTDETHDIPIFIVTGHKFEGHKDVALEREMRSRNSVVAYFTKPFEFADLIDELRRYVALGADQPAS